MNGENKNKLGTASRLLELPREGRCRPAQVASVMGICRATLYNRIREGKLPPLRKDGERISFWFVEEIRPFLRPPEAIDAQD